MTEINGERSLSGRIFDQIRENILNRTYEDGKELKENTLAKEFGVSRTPIREALRQLELDGLVEMIPNRGAFVTGISEKDAADIFAIRSVLEGLCARWVVANIAKDQLRALEESLILAEFHIKKGEDSEALSEYDSRFHELMYASCGSRVLERMLTDMHKLVMMTRQKSTDVRGRKEKSLKEHKELYEAIVNKDADLAEKLAVEHVSHVISNLQKLKE